ncbi:hypothetical protein COCVIDRAFT_28684 [Bipolaris victoriae FI3]|uniref:Uncharacterized protein n=1 Tax=Bipolaris victoriae (strain FI3) TaxID=930091 RepID=W7E2L3_BIPV3|nr:hypothetical protein COCVIDRAFT_28684 [Bipolaris victoriae FI3]
MKDSSTSGVEQNTVRPRLPMPTASTGTQEAARSILNAEEGKPACNYTRTGHLATGDLNLPDNPPVEPSTLKRAALLTTQTSQPQDGFFNILKCSLTRKKARTMTSTSTGSLPPPAATPAPGKYRPAHDFRDPLEIPFHGKKILVYRHADAHISQEHHRRFPDILELFRQQTQRDKNLSASSQANTEYKVKMCGVNPEDSHASILILHPLEYFEQGKCILKSLSARTLENQYNNKKMGPIFKLYLFLSEGSQMLGNFMNSLSIHIDKENLLGAQLVSNDERYQTSTITCSVQFDGNDTVFALTTAHAFEDNEAEESDKPAWNPDDTIPNYSGSESDDICDRGPSNTVYECDTCDDGPLYTLDDYDWERIEKEAITAKEDREPSLDNPKKPDSSKQKVERHPSRFEIAPG